MPARTEEHWWGWIVVCASFLVQAISLGTCSAVSGLTVQWLQHFQKSKEITAWIASLNLATTFCSGNVIMHVSINLSLLTATIFNLNFHPLEVASR